MGDGRSGAFPPRPIRIKPSYKLSVTYLAPQVLEPSP
jgi:hypothetical protein